MKWKEKRILFYLFNHTKGIDKHNMQQLAMASAGSMDGAHALIKKFLTEDYLIKKESKFKLSIKSENLIEMLYLNAQELMLNVKNILQNNFDRIVEIKGGVTGLFFTYTEKSHMFRFHPEEHKDKLLIKIRLPNLIGEAIDSKSNELYISEKVLLKTKFLETVVNAHLEMIDKLNGQEV